uniref:Uncharacterized protein n=1 Tax=Prolemur simus TaxID=1328070 RepID=A0A8C9ADZ1_PROSS
SAHLSKCKPDLDTPSLGNFPSNLTSIFHIISCVPVSYVTYPAGDFSIGYFTFLHFAFLFCKRSVQINSVKYW